MLCVSEIAYNTKRIFTLKTMKKTKLFLEMQDERLRILKSIHKITTLEQVIATFEWIRLFNEKFKAADVAASLRYELKDVRLVRKATTAVTPPSGII